VGAAALERKELSAEVEDADRAALNLDELTPTGWDFVDRGNDVFGHGL
jgi:hypothetical protein